MQICEYILCMSHRENLEIWRQFVSVARVRALTEAPEDVEMAMYDFASGTAFHIVKIIKKNPKLAEALRTGAGYTAKLDKAVGKFSWRIVTAFKLPPKEMRPKLEAELLKFARDTVGKSPNPATAFNSLKKDFAQKLDAFETAAAEFSRPTASSKESTAAGGDGPADGKLGRWVFSPNRIDGAPTDEPDTGYEEDLYQSISDYVTANKPIPPDVCAKIREAMSEYGSIFHPPSPEKIVYRGMGMPIRWLKNTLGEKFDELVELTPSGLVASEGSWTGRMVYTPRGRGSSSWSTEEDAAEEFTDSGSNEVEVMLEADPRDNPGSFLDLYELYGVKPIDRYVEESEVMGMGPIVLRKLTWRPGRHVRDVDV
jgi:hypothetical protein